MPQVDSEAPHHRHGNLQVHGRRACKPGSVCAEPRLDQDGHSSGTRFTPRLERSTRGESGENRPGMLAGDQGHPDHTPLCLILLRVGFTKQTGSPRPLVGSYPTLSPLPRITHPATTGDSARATVRRSGLCGTFPSLAAGRRYRPLCSLEPGLSSTNPNQPPSRPAARASQGLGGTAAAIRPSSREPETIRPLMIDRGAAHHQPSDTAACASPADR
jgi:hypothetical protein